MTAGSRIDGRCAMIPAVRVRRRASFRAEAPGKARRGDEMARWSSRARAASGSRADPRRGARALDAPPRYGLSSHWRTPCRVVLAALDADRTTVGAHEPSGVGRGRHRGRAYDVINNAGSDLYQRGFGGDRGFLQRDDGQYELPADVFAWCGGAVLLRAEYLDRRRPVRRAPVPLLRGHRPVVAWPARRLALPLRARRRRAPPPRRVLAASAARRSASTRSATGCSC